MNISSQATEVRGTQGTQSSQRRRRAARVCPVCRSTVFRSDGMGFIYCEFGHQYQGHRVEQDDGDSGARATRRVRIHTNVSARREERNLRREEARRTYFGAHAPLSATCAVLHFAIRRLAAELAVSVLQLPSCNDQDANPCVISQEIFQGTVAQLWASYITIMGFNDIPILFTNDLPSDRHNPTSSSQRGDNEPYRGGSSSDEVTDSSFSHLRLGDSSDGGYLMEFASRLESNRFMSSTDEDTDDQGGPSAANHHSDDNSQRQPMLTPTNMISSKTIPNKITPNTSSIDTVESQRDWIFQDVDPESSSQQGHEQQQQQATDSLDRNVMDTYASSQEDMELIDGVSFPMDNTQGQLQQRRKTATRKHRRASRVGGEDSYELWNTLNDDSHAAIGDTETSQPNRWRQIHPASIFPDGPLPFYSLLFLYLTCRLLRIPILIEDLRSYAVTGKLSYFSTLKSVSERIRKRVSIIHTGVETKTIPTVSNMDSHSQKLITLLERCAHIQFPAINHVPIWGRLIKVFSLQGTGLLESTAATAFLLHSPPNYEKVEKRKTLTQSELGFTNESDIAAMFCISFKLFFPINAVSLLDLVSSAASINEDNNVGLQHYIDLDMTLDVLESASKAISKFKDWVIEDELQTSKRFAEWGNDGLRYRFTNITDDEDAKDCDPIAKSKKDLERLELIRKYIVELSFPVMYNYGTDELITKDYPGLEPSSEQNTQATISSGRLSRSDRRLRGHGSSNHTRPEIARADALLDEFKFKVRAGRQIRERDSAKYSQASLDILEPSAVKNLLKLTKILLNAVPSSKSGKEVPDPNDISAKYADFCSKLMDSSKSGSAEYWTKLDVEALEEELNDILRAIVLDDRNALVVVALLVVKLSIRLYSTLLQVVCYYFGKNVKDLMDSIKLWEQRLFNCERVVQQGYFMSECGF